MSLVQGMGSVNTQSYPFFGPRGCVLGGRCFQIWYVDGCRHFSDAVGCGLRPSRSSPGQAPWSCEALAKLLDSLKKRVVPIQFVGDAAVVAVFAVAVRKVSIRDDQFSETSDLQSSLDVEA